MKGKVNCTCGWSWNKSDSSVKDMYICHECGRDNSNNMKNGGWLDKHDDSQASAPEGFQGDGYSNVGRDYSPAWGGQFQMGGSVYPVNYVPQAQTGGSFPGATGFSYARTNDPAPSEGPYAKKTMASAQNGKEMQYYQQGLDFQPKTISQNGSWLDKWEDEHPSVRSIQNDSMNRKIQESKGRGKETTITKKDNTRTVTPKEIKKLSGRQQNELAQRQSEEQARKEQMFENMQEAYKSPLMSPGYFTPEGAAIGALQGATKMGPDLYEGNYKGAAMDALMALPIGIPAAKTLGRVLTTEEGLLSNAHKLNPWAFKPDPEAYYRGIGKSGFDQAIETGVIGGRPNSTFGEDVYMSSMLDVAKRYGKDFRNPFNKNFFVEGAGNKTSYIAEIPRTSLTNPNSPIPYNVGTNQYPTYFHEFKNPKPIPLDDVKLLKEHWLQGYKEVPKPNSSIENINNIHGYDPIDWDIFNKKVDPRIDEYIRRDNLQPSASKGANSVLSDFKKRIKTPEGIRRAEELGVDTNYLDKLKLLEDNTTYGYSNDKTIGLHKDLPKEVVKSVTRHEIEHGVKNAIREQDMQKANKWYKNLPFMNNSAEKMKALNTNTTPIDDILSELELRNEPSVFDELTKKKEVTGKDIDVSNFREKLSHRQNATDYFDRGSQGNEKSAFAAEAQQYMLDEGIIKHPYETITPEKIKEAHIKALFDKKNPIRLFHIMKNTDKNYNTVAKALNKMLTVTGAGALGATAIEQKKDGGIIKDDRGYWNPKNKGKVVQIDQSKPNSFIDMNGVYEPLLGVSDKGEQRMMYPGEQHQFQEGTEYVREYPKGKLAKNGLRQEQKGLQNLDNLTNFTNYNKPQPGSWLEKYN